jgi:hypothetical protein
LRQAEARQREALAARDKARAEAQAPAWGTPQAKAREIERIRREIEARRAAEKGGK